MMGFLKKMATKNPMTSYIGASYKKKTMGSNNKDEICKYWNAA
jgi:hypothetical protein